MERIAMSREERDELHWLKRVEAVSMTHREAAEKMGVTARWVRKLVKRMKKEGDAVVVHGLRGRASNRKLSDKTQRQALTILKKPDWHDFGPTFAAEQLAKRHQIHVGKETLRGWMIEAGLWKNKVQTIRFPSHPDSVRVMDQTVENAVRYRRVADLLVRTGNLLSEDRRAHLISQPLLSRVRLRKSPSFLRKKF